MYIQTLEEVDVGLVTCSVTCQMLTGNGWSPVSLAACHSKSVTFC